MKIFSAWDVHKRPMEFDVEQVESYYHEPGFLEIRFKQGGLLKILKENPRKKGAVLVDDNTFCKIWNNLTLTHIIGNTITKTE